GLRGAERRSVTITMTGHRDFAISDVIHKAYVDLNEVGTEAAAATAGTMRSLAIRVPTQPPPVFRADHPFLFLIRDNHSNSILFIGGLRIPGVNRKQAHISPALSYRRNICRYTEKRIIYPRR
ncbi:MAG: serpin family protein, partial [Acidobacteriaceae bacterium]